MSRTRILLTAACLVGILWAGSVRAADGGSAPGANAGSAPPADNAGSAPPASRPDRSRKPTAQTAPEIRPEDLPPETGPWLWPPPQRLEELPGRMPLAGKAVLIADSAGRRVAAVAEALCKYVNFYHKANWAVVRVKGLSDLPYLLVVAKPGDVDGAKALAASADVKAIPTELPDRRMHRAESYVLRTGPAGAALAAPEVWGLLQGARTVMQLAKAAAKTGQTALPAVSIIDWPDTPEHIFCAVQPGSYVRQGKEQVSAALLSELKYNHLMISLSNGLPVYPLRPEVRSVGQPDALVQWANAVRARGVPTWPWTLGEASGPHEGGGSLVYYLDTDEFYQIKFEMMDLQLEDLRPDAINICMSEQYLAKQRWNGWKRNKEAHFANLIKHCNFCLRRGVTPAIWGDNFVIGGNFDPWELVLKTDPATARRMPRELIIAPWDYTNREIDRYNKVWPTLAGPEFGFRAMNGCATWGTDGTFHAQHMAHYGKELPLMWGLIAVIWGGADGGLPAINRCAGSLWNCRLGTNPWVVEALNKRRVKAAPYDIENPDFLEPLGLEAMLWREPSRPVPEYVRRLTDTDPLVWEDAREELVGFGAAGAGEILRAMAESLPIEPATAYEGLNRPLRWKLEGILSRIARDGRHGEARGELDVKSVQPYLEDACPYVRDMAAELLASCAPPNRALPILLAGLNNEKCRLSCVRAAGVAGLAEAAPRLVAMAADEKAPLEARVAAARYLASLKPRGGAGALLTALRGAKDPGLQKELIRTLSLVNATEAADEIARHLARDFDRFVRIRAVTALVNLKSPRAGDVESWLVEDDRAIVEVGCWALGKARGQDALAVIERSIKAQGNETLKDALKYQLDKKLFTRW